MKASELAGVQAPRVDRALAGAYFDASADAVRVKRVVVVSKRRYGSGVTRITHRRSTSGSLAGSDRIASRSSIRRSIGRDPEHLCTRALPSRTTRRVAAGSSARLEVRLEISLQALDDALGLWIGGFVGPFDLGTMVIGFALRVNPITA